MNCRVWRALLGLMNNSEVKDIPDAMSVTPAAAEQLWAVIWMPRPDLGADFVN